MLARAEGSGAKGQLLGVYVDTLDRAIHKFPNRFHDPNVLCPEAGLRTARPRVADMDRLTCQRGKNDRLSDQCPTA